MTPALNQYISKIKKVFNNNTCAVCDARKIDFYPIPPEYKVESDKYGYKYYGQGEMTSLETYFCEKCWASDRERLYMYFIKNDLPKLIGKNFSQIDMAHFAPENTLGRYLKEMGFKSYTTFDLRSDKVDIQADLTDMPHVKDNSYDFFLSSHMLEHVDDDVKACKELHRIYAQAASESSWRRYVL